MEFRGLKDALNWAPFIRKCLRREIKCLTKFQMFDEKFPGMAKNRRWHPHVSLKKVEKKKVLTRQLSSTGDFRLSIEIENKPAITAALNTGDIYLYVYVNILHMRHAWSFYTHKKIFSEYY